MEDLSFKEFQQFDYSLFLILVYRQLVEIFTRRYQYHALRVHQGLRLIGVCFCTRTAELSRRYLAYLMTCCDVKDLGNLSSCIIRMIWTVCLDFKAFGIQGTQVLPSLVVILSYQIM